MPLRRGAFRGHVGEDVAHPQPWTLGDSEAEPLVCHPTEVQPKPRSSRSTERQQAHLSKTRRIRESPQEWREHAGLISLAQSFPGRGRGDVRGASVRCGGWPRPMLSWLGACDQRRHGNRNESGSGRTDQTSFNLASARRTHHFTDVSGYD